MKFHECGSRVLLINMRFLGKVNLIGNFPFADGINGAVPSTLFLNMFELQNSYSSFLTLCIVLFEF